MGRIMRVSHFVFSGPLAPGDRAFTSVDRSEDLSGRGSGLKTRGPHDDRTITGGGPRPADGRESLSPGTEVDHFRVIRLIGAGGMGEVYLARDLQLGRRVALKLIRADRLGAESTVEQFLFEAQTTARFSHPHIVLIYGTGSFGDSPYVALEYLDGENLRERIEQQALGPVESLRIGQAVAKALKEAHRHGILHRDLKPENIVIPKDGRVRVVDFGLANTVTPPDDPASRMAPGMGTTLPGGLKSRAGIKGTPGYMAPEQWMQTSCTAATDVWALGVLLYELFTESRPFPELEIVQQALAVCSPTEAPRADAERELPPHVADLIADCLKKRAMDRPSAAQLVDRIDVLLQSAGRRKGEDNPFRGLLPFTKRHADVFFGRDAEIETFLERMRLQPVLPVVGPSGAGKSSFVQAGVLPRLLERDTWRVLRLRPGADPFHALATRVLRPETHESSRRLALTQLDRSRAPDPSGVHALAHQFRETPGLLNLELQKLAMEWNTRVLLYVDQMEELFTLVEDGEEQRAFLNAVSGAADDVDEPVRVIVTVRDDFLGRLAVGPRVQEAMSRVTVIQRPGPDALREILCRPLQARGYEYEDKQMVEEMIATVGDEPTCLPLLQFTARQLWEQRDQTKALLLRKTYEELGGVSGALAKHADGVLAGLSSRGQQLARALLLRLVTADRTRRVLAKDHAVAGLGSESTIVLDRLIQARLISIQRTATQEDGATLLELAHESLVQTWSTLARWIDESREEIAGMAELHEAALRWQKYGERPGDLWTADSLSDAERLVRRASSPPAELISDFLGASRHRVTRRLRRQRIWLGVGVVTLSLIATGALLASLAIKRNETVAQEQRELAEGKEHEAQVQRARAVQGQGYAYQEGARLAWNQGSTLEARSKLRAAFETYEESPPALARALWREFRQTETNWTWKRLGTSVYDLAVSPNGRQIAAAAKDRVVELLDTETRAVRTLRGHTDQVRAVDYSPSGETLVSGSWDGSLRLWDPHSGMALAVIDDSLGPVSITRYSPDGRLLAVGHGAEELELRDSTSGAIVRKLVGHAGASLTVDFSPNGQLLASGAVDHTIRIWDVASGRNLRTLRKHNARVMAVAFHPDGNELASAGRHGTLQLWNPHTGEQGDALELRAPSAERVSRGGAGRLDIKSHFYQSLDYSPDGKLLAAVADDRGIVVFEPRDRSYRILGADTVGAYRLRFDRSNNRLTSVGWDRSSHGNVRVTDLSDPEPALMVSGPRSECYGVDFSPDGKSLASTSVSGPVLIWDVASGRVKHDFRGQAGSTRGIAYSPDGRHLATGSYTNELFVWDTQSYERVHHGIVDAGTFRDIAYHPSGTRLLLAGSRGLAMVDTESWETIRIFNHDAMMSYSTTFSPDGRFAAAGDERGRVLIWSLETGEQIYAESQHEANVIGLKYSLNGEQLFSASADRTLRRLDLASGRSTEVTEFPDRTYWIDLRPDGRELGIPTSGGDVFLWNLAEGSQRKLIGHSNEVNEITYNPDGTLAATASDDGTIRLWDVETGRPAWRGVALLRDPPIRATHLGWHTLNGAEVEASSTGWMRAVEDRARFAEETSDGQTLCMRTVNGFELWSRASDTMRGQRTGPLNGVRAIGEGCVVWAEQGLWRYDSTGTSTQLFSEERIEAVGPGDNRLLIALEDGLHSRIVSMANGSDTFEPHCVVGSGVSALLQSHGEMILGFPDGSIEVLSANTAEIRLTLDDTPSSAVTRLLEGPSETLLAGFSSGQFGLWSQRDGARLISGQVHGPISHLLIQEQTLHALSDLGQYLSWDLSAFYRSRCELLKAVWARVPTVWQNGRPVLQPPPQGHDCATKE